MSTHLITGYAGKEHITSADQGSFNAAVMGGGEFVMERGEQFRCQVISNNNVRIYDGDALMQGRHIIIDRNTYEETTHENGTQGYKRIDLIVLSYEKDEDSSVESVKLEVIKGAPAENNPVVPEYTKGDILNSGALKNQMPLYKIPFDGLSIGEPVKLFTTVPTLEGMKADVDEKVDEKIAEMEEAFEKLETGIEEEIAAAGKPLSSNAADWPMIQNYGEYSADAKTVGEEFSKVNESLEGLKSNEWKKLSVVSGINNPISLPTDFNELYVECRPVVTPSNNTTTMSMFIPKCCLLDTNKDFTTGASRVGSTQLNYFCNVRANKTNISLQLLHVGSTEYTTTATMEVYYK